MNSQIDMNSRLYCMGACEEARDWARNKTIEQIVAECHRGDWLIWLAHTLKIDRFKILKAKQACTTRFEDMCLPHTALSCEVFAVCHVCTDGAFTDYNPVAEARENKRQADICRSMFGADLVETINNRKQSIVYP